MTATLVILCLCASVYAETRLDPLVSTKQGLIRGLRADDGQYSKFLGVPYALVDENNPFGPALPYPESDGVFEAYDNSTFCAQQTLRGEIAGQIQCLQLHVYVPDKANSQNRLPVLVWIHGGGFSQGIPGEDHPRTLVQNDVIVVAINYRLGVYGFLCLDTPEFPGNQGLKDQVLALRWIKENIGAFGGDPNKVTAFGESAGGIAVNLHLYSEYEKLFDRAIIQSGPALSIGAFAPSYEEAPIEIAEKLGYKTDDINDATLYLTSVDPLLLTATAYEIGLMSKIRPCVEKTFDGVENFITEYPINIKNAPKVRSTSVIIGYTSEELGVEFTPPPQGGNMYNSFEDTLYTGFIRHEDLDGAVDLIKHFYIGDETEEINVRQEVAQFRGDLMFNHPTQRMVEQLIDNGVKAVYRYVFSFIGDKNVTGASHGSDLAFLFDNTQFFATPGETIKKHLLFKRFTKLWTNFAKYGNPTPEISELIPVEWKPATKEEQFSLNIDSELTLSRRPDRERMTFWDLFYRAYGKYQIGYKEDSV